MRIIQSFAEFDEGNVYYDNNTEYNKKYLNFYTFLLSFLTLKKYYGSVTMYCNQKAYDSFIRFIPYDEINIFENVNSFKYWSFYKIDIIKLMMEKFIHVDPDVFLFDDIYSKFINGEVYDAMVQDALSEERNSDFGGEFVRNNKKFCVENDIIDPEIYDGKCYSCGTVGMSLEVKKEYIKLHEKLKNGLDKNLINISQEKVSPVIEELSLYLLSLKNKYNVYEILPFDQVHSMGVSATGDIHKYTHMWCDSKFNLNYVNLIKNKISELFPEYMEYVNTYEKEVMENVDKTTIYGESIKHKHWWIPIGLNNL